MSMDEIITYLRNLQNASRVPLERLALKLAIASLVLRATPETTRWVVPMLRDQARDAACRGDDHRAKQFDTAAYVLREIYNV